MLNAVLNNQKNRVNACKSFIGVSARYEWFWQLFVQPSYSVAHANTHMQTLMLVPIPWLFRKAECWEKQLYSLWMSGFSRNRDEFAKLHICQGMFALLEKGSLPPASFFRSMIIASNMLRTMDEKNENPDESFSYSN